MMPDRRRDSGVEKRMDRFEELLMEIRDQLTKHVAEGAMIKPALEELVTLWRGSKLVGVIIASIAAALSAGLAIVEWTRAHLK